MMIRLSPEMNTFLQSRDFLLHNRNNYAAAYQGFSWPVLDHFNWALDYFAPLAFGNQNPALIVLDETGNRATITFEAMSRASNRAANFFRSIGVNRGEALLLMLGNEVALWEILLGACKLGAVIIPCSTLLTPDDLQDRLDRGEPDARIAWHTHPFGPAPHRHRGLWPKSARANL